MLRTAVVVCILTVLTLLPSACARSGSDRGAPSPGVATTPAANAGNQSSAADISVDNPPAPESTASASGPVTLAEGSAGATAIVSRELLSNHLVSGNVNGHPANGPVLDVGLSADGFFAAYTSKASNLVDNDGNGVEDVFLFDSLANETLLISANIDGQSGNGWSGGPAVSADGRRVAFYSWASDLTVGDSNAVQDVFLWDRTGGTERVSLAPAGAQANDRSGDSRQGAHPAISADGAVIAYHSQASNLVENDTNGSQDVFVYDVAQRVTSRVSVSSGGVEADDDSRDPALAAAGRLVAFSSRAQNLSAAVPNPTRASQIYIHDRAQGTTTLISAAEGMAGDSDSVTPAVSGDGGTVVFASSATNLTDRDDNGVSDIFLYDGSNGSLERISVTPNGAPGNGDSFAPAISLDGRYVGYASEASNLVKDDSNGAVDIFVYDRLTRHTGRASVGVTGQWTGLEANGDSQGPPTFAADGHLLAYVSQATNLVAGEAPEFAQAYTLVRDDIPAYTVGGRVLDSKNQPIADVTVKAGAYQTTTDADGRYELDHVIGGTYTVLPIRDETTFVPARRTVSVVADADGMDFTVTSNGGARLSFLSLPLGEYFSTSTFLHALRDSDEGGWVDAWFDHYSPDKEKNGALQLWDGRERTTGPFNAELGCYESRCYDGHDGTDFPYRDPIPETSTYEPISIHAAASGRVASITDNCDTGGRWCNRGYGNEVILLHDMGYFTRYSHLASIYERDALSIGAYIDAGDVLGTMGSTGNSFGAHLHFAVHQDDGNGQWDGEDQDLPVDPFGWSDQGPDPWAAATGAVSRWMWNEHPTVERLVFGDHGATLQDQTGSITVSVPPGALAGQARLRLEPGAPVSPPPPGARSAGQTLRVRLLDWYAPDGPAAPIDELTQTSLAAPIGIAIELDAENTRHLDMGTAHIVRWQEDDERWEALPTIVEEAATQVRATSEFLGRFDVQAPLLCTDDVMEPDDDYFAASTVELGEAGQKGLFDLTDDEDWLRFEAAQGQQIEIRVEDIAEGVALVASIFDRDGLTELASAASSSGESIGIAWSAPRDGTYFVRVAPVGSSGGGCDATYTIALE